MSEPTPPKYDAGGLLWDALGSFVIGFAQSCGNFLAEKLFGKDGDDDEKPAVKSK